MQMVAAPVLRHTNTKQDERLSLSRPEAMDVRQICHSHRWREEYTYLLGEGNMEGGLDSCWIWFSHRTFQTIHQASPAIGWFHLFPLSFLFPLSSAEVAEVTSISLSRTKTHPISEILQKKPLLENPVGNSFLSTCGVSKDEKQRRGTHGGRRPRSHSLHVDWRSVTLYLWILEKQHWVPFSGRTINKSYR